MDLLLGHLFFIRVMYRVKHRLFSLLTTENNTAMKKINKRYYTTVKTQKKKSLIK
jgi:hypothetical protein